MTHMRTHLRVRQMCGHMCEFLLTPVAIHVKPSTGVATHVTTCEYFFRCVHICRPPRGPHRDWGSIWTDVLDIKLKWTLPKTRVTVNRCQISEICELLYMGVAGVAFHTVGHRNTNKSLSTNVGFDKNLYMDNRYIH